jgi:RimJ/RimL family protein N-acetyltransferase
VGTHGNGNPLPLFMKGGVMNMSLDNIYCERLRLVPVTLQITRTLLENNKSELNKLGLNADNQWPTVDTMDILPIINDTLSRDKEPSGFEFWMIVKNETMQVIGDIGFHGKPNEKGEVTVGYGIIGTERGKGYGYEALKAIMEWLNTKENVKIVKADCLITNEPSARILKKVGMKETGKDLEYIYWEYVKKEK